MMKKIVTLKSQNEALRMKAILEEKNIPFVIRSFHDSSYSSVFQNLKGWGVLEANEEFELEILNFYSEGIIISDENVDTSEFVTIQKPASKISFFVFSTVFLFLILVAVSWFYYKKSKQFSEYVRSESTYSNWESGDEILVERWKFNDKKCSEYEDKDFNNIYENMMLYDTAGTFIANLYDINHNGRTDKMVYFNKKNEPIEEFSDINEDGRNDNHILTLPGNYLLIFADKNFDKEYDVVEIRDKENVLIKTYTLEEFLSKLR